MKIITLIAILILIGAPSAAYFGTTAESPEVLKDCVSAGALAGADILHKNEWDDQALVLCDRVLEISPDDIAARHMKADTLVSLGQLEEALWCYEQLQQVESGFFDTGVWEEKAALHMQLGDADAWERCQEEILEYYENSVGTSPHESDAWIQKGRTLVKLQRYDEALECYDIAIEVAPSDPIPWIGKGDAYLLKSSGDQEKLQEMYENLKAGNTGYSYEEPGSGIYQNYGNAFECYYKAVEIDPALYPVITTRILGQYTQSIEMYQSILE